jgi:uncharacterized protein YqjF (DUF2071 family)
MLAFNHAVLTETAHRPWPLPVGPWVMSQTWHDLLFAHWPVAQDRLRELVPAQFELDLFDGQAWLAVVPFHMTHVTPRFVPSLPWISAFPELNVRTYVRVDDKPGVFFFSLDAGSAVAVGAARALLNLPYFSAEMQVAVNGRVDYASRRLSQPSAEFRGWYQATGHPHPPAPDSLEYFLTERYCLYAVDHRFRAYRLDIHHPPWQLDTAVAEITVNTMAEAAGLRLPSIAPLLHFVKRQDMVCWAPQRIG